MEFERPNLVSVSFDAVIGARVLANRRNWLLVAPIANPAMVTMFDHTLDPRPGSPYLPWSGEFVGKYLISAVQDLRMSRDGQLESAVAGVVQGLTRHQGADGYLGPFDGDDRIFGDNWDVWGHYHCVLGLYEWFRYRRDARALDACRKAADHLSTRLSGPGMIAKLRHPAMNLAFSHVAALLHQETGESRYLNLARLFEQAWASVPDGGDYVAKFQTPGSLFAALGPTARWERLHSLQAVGELFRITGEERYRRAFINAWQGIRASDRHSTGGFSAIERATGNPFDPRPIETCATVAWMALTVDMLRLTGSCEPADELELSTWNTSLGSQSPDGRWWTYNTPMGGISTTGMDAMELPPPLHRPPAFEGTRRPTPHDLGFQDRPGASYLSCCSTNAPRGLGMLSEWAVMAAADGIVVNFYGPSRFTLLTPTGNQVTIEQRTRYPVHGRVELVVTPARDEAFAVRLRVPSWSTTTTVAVNGASRPGVVPGSYHTVQRTWRSSDTIVLELDLRSRALIGADPPPGCDPHSGKGAKGRLALYRGPILLAYDERHDRFDAQHLPPMAATSQITLDQSVPAPEDRRMVRVSARTDTGEVKLGDFASAGMPGTVAGGPDVEGRVFQFGRNDGSVIAQRIRLLADGTIQGHAHPNEARWRRENGALAFFTSDGRASTRFVWDTWENGRIVLRGRFEFDERVVHELREVDLGVEGKWFQFARTDGSIITSLLRLRAGGSVEGHSHPNERSWAQEDGTLVFRDGDGRVTTRFTKTNSQFGRVDHSGPFLSDAGVTHQLRQLDRGVTGKVWQFHRPHVFPISILLHVDGSIESDHPNETFWITEGDHLVFLDPLRRPTTRFALGKNPDGRMTWKGEFLPDPAITHLLVEWNIDLTWGEDSRYISWLPGEN
ncbi:beta-L-arabinofuranosidase domain-containing protein [Embleya sp. NPDC005575]|uniref:beta-L-arabinofuranosidase domain-containing protein n=1 Tax=Embleya sp. NPDC005575 TaxID=3156892 RepID=UPI0033A48CA9